MSKHCLEADYDFFGEPVRVVLWDWNDKPRGKTSERLGLMLAKVWRRERQKWERMPEPFRPKSVYAEVELDGRTVILSMAFPRHHLTVFPRARLEELVALPKQHEKN